MFKGVNMVKIYPENIQNKDELYRLMKTIVCALLFVYVYVLN